MRPTKATKRGRGDDISESFWGDDSDSESGSYLRVVLKSGQPLKGRGWPWVQACVRGILGGQDKVAKANFQHDGSLLLKTKTAKQTSQLLRATMFGSEECEIKLEGRLNTSKGTIHAYDLVDLTEEEVGRWLQEFGVINVRRISRKVGGQSQNTPTLILTFDKPTCPTQLVFDYTVYKVRQYVPNPLMCHRCGQFGHIAATCRGEEVCLTCGSAKHDGECTPKCLHCSQSTHSCLSRECPTWKKEKEICEIKVKQDVSYAHARRLYNSAHQAPTPSYSAVLRSSYDPSNQEVSLRDRVDNLEKKMDRMLILLDKVLSQAGVGTGCRDDTSSTHKDVAGSQSQESVSRSLPESTEQPPAVSVHASHPVCDNTTPGPSTSPTYDVMEEDSQEAGPSQEIGRKDTARQHPKPKSGSLGPYQIRKTGVSGGNATVPANPDNTQLADPGPSTGRRMPSLTRMATHK